jgi:glutamate-1-semialdehyde aminotransferase
MDHTARNYSLEDLDRETLFHPNTSIVDHLRKGPHIVTQGRGVRVRDHQGRDLIDCCAGLWCVNIGYGREEMGNAQGRASLGIEESESKIPGGLLTLAAQIPPVDHMGGRRPLTG